MCQGNLQSGMTALAQGLFLAYGKGIDIDLWWPETVHVLTMDIKE